MTSFGTSTKKKKKRTKALLPIIGLAFATLLGVISFYLAPTLIDFGSNQSEDLKTQFDELRNNEKYPAKTLDYITTAILWLLLMGLSMFLASLFIGKDPDKETLKNMSASPANKKAMIKQMKRDLKIAKEQAKKREARQKKGD
jgi:hypothetical protein